MPRWLAVVIASVGFATSCTKSIDIWLVNPCAKSLEIHTFDLPPERIGGEQPNKRISLPAVSVVKVQDAFTDAAGKDWSVQIVDPARTLAVDGDRLTHETLALPAEVCPAAD